MDISYRIRYSALEDDRLKVLQDIKRDVNATNGGRFSHVLHQRNNQFYSRCKTPGCTFALNYNYRMKDAAWVLISVSDEHQHFNHYEIKQVEVKPVKIKEESPDLDIKGERF